jgi:hypothetical protein
MTISGGYDIQFVQARLHVGVCIFLIIAFLSPSFHHHEDETSHETCLICILVESLSGFFIIDPPSLLRHTTFFLLIVPDQFFGLSHTRFFYYSRSPPSLYAYSKRSLLKIENI